MKLQAKLCLEDKRDMEDEDEDIILDW